MELKNKLSILYYDGTSYTDNSNEAADFKRDSFSANIIAGSDYIYVGYEKFINALYVHMVTPNVNIADLTMEYYSETGWKSLEICDETNGLTRNGFVTWERQTDGANTIVNGKEQCWFRIAVSADTSAVEFQGINLIFSDDNSISDYEPGLLDDCFYPNGQTSHILRHVAARNYIMSVLTIKADKNSDSKIDYWDILDIYELREAANYYAISQIYFNLSDDPEDQYWAKYLDYRQKFDKMFELGSPLIDLNNNGQVEVGEKVSVKTSRWSR